MNEKESQETKLLSAMPAVFSSTIVLLSLSVYPKLVLLTSYFVVLTQGQVQPNLTVLAEVVQKAPSGVLFTGILHPQSGRSSSQCR